MKRWKDPLRVAYFHQLFQTSICTTSSTYGSRNVFADSLGEKPTWFVTRTITSSVFNTKMRQKPSTRTVSYTHLRAHETRHDLVCRLLLEKKKKKRKKS